MRPFLPAASGLLAAMAGPASGQGSSNNVTTALVEAIAGFSQLSAFSQLLTDNPTLLPSVIPANLTGTAITVLVPSNAAFENFINQTGHELGQLPLDQLTAIFKYQILAAAITAHNLTGAASGIVVPTLLTGQQYDNRTAGAQLLATYGQVAAQGNVLFVTPSAIAPAAAHLLRPRQSDSTTFNVRAGLGQTAKLAAVDGV